MKKPMMIVAVALLLVGFAATATPSFGYANKVTYTGQGLIGDDFGGFDLQTEICGVANGAEVDGPYILWVFTATAASNADITGPWGTAAMTKFGNGTFKYVSAWYAPSTLVGNVFGTYDGKAKNVQLVISHGCRPFTHGAWCSPGFWRNATDGAWALTGYARSAMFNSTVVPDFYDTALTTDASLNTVLTTNGGTYKGPASGPFGMSPFNATGAFLTDNIPGFDFDPSVVSSDDSQTCPIDHFGHFKN